MDNDSVRVGFFNYLMNLDISKVDWINDRPITEIYEDLRILNIHPIIYFIEDLVLKRYLFNKCEEKNMLTLSMNNLFNKFNRYCKLKQCNLTFTDKLFGIPERPTSASGRNFASVFDQEQTGMASDMG